MTLERLIQMISDITRIPQEEISEESLLFEDLGIDSLEMFKIYAEAEEALDAIYDYSYLAASQTVGVLYDRIAGGRQVHL